MEKLKIRELGEEDIFQMMDLFRMTVLNVNIRDYTKEEVEDWASCGDNPERWKELMSCNKYVGAFDGRGVLAGFASMNEDGYLHSMFVHKDFQRKGIATQLLSEIERTAREYGVVSITSEVSLTARPFFEKNGYEVVRAQKRKAKRLELTNFLMSKTVDCK